MTMISCDKNEVSRWFPSSRYYSNHADRLGFSFSNLPDLASGFTCLCIGSWGAEVPFLRGMLGASRVVCVRAPEKDIPRFENRTIDAPNGQGSYQAELYALDIEAEELPGELQNEFDLVLAWEILEHLRQDPPFMIWQSIRSLKPGGCFSITTPNALWHYYTVAQLFGDNALGLKLQPHIPFATHWRLYSPREVKELCEQMGCREVDVTSFLKTEPFSWKSRLFQQGLRFLRRNSDNGACSFGQHVHVVARKSSDTDIYRPQWLFPVTNDGGRTAHLDGE